MTNIGQNNAFAAKQYYFGVIRDRIGTFAKNIESDLHYSSAQCKCEENKKLNNKAD